MTTIQTPEVDSRGVELYDSIMEHINTDLLSANLDAVDQKRPGESDEDFEIRMEEYNNAFEEFERIASMMEEGQAIKARRAKQQKRFGLFAKESAEQSEDVASAEEKLISFEQE